MVSQKEREILSRIVKHCKRIEEWADSLFRESFHDDADAQEIVLYNLIKISELASGLSAEFVSEFDGVPWRAIQMIKDKVGQGCGVVDIDRTWRTTSEEIKPLRKYCKRILKEDD